MILTGGINLSMQYTLVLCNVVSAQVISGQNENTWMALAVSILISAVIGLINGFGVYFLKIPAMIMTLATGSAVWGIAYIYCNGAPKGRTSEILSLYSPTEKVRGDHQRSFSDLDAPKCSCDSGAEVHGVRQDGLCSRCQPGECELFGN